MRRFVFLINLQGDFSLKMWVLPIWKMDFLNLIWLNFSLFKKKIIYSNVSSSYPSGIWKLDIWIPETSENRNSNGPTIWNPDWYSDAIWILVGFSNVRLVLVVILFQPFENQHGFQTASEKRSGFQMVGPFEILTSYLMVSLWII
jgi:uncharacterized membrane protein